MVTAITSLTVMGLVMGAILGLAARWLAVEEDPLEKELQAMLPGSQCGQCGFVGCAQAAAALAKGEATVTLCPPGGKAVAEDLAKRLGVTANLSEHEAPVPQMAVIDEAACLGCLRCMNECSVAAILGAAKQIHVVLTDLCHGCGKCVDVCKPKAVSLTPIQPTVGTWHWPKPAIRMKEA
jgi:electron transport complex protein RnfB